MRICVYGAGATGGHFAVKLALAGHAVSVIARGPHLNAIRDHGLTLVAGDTSCTAAVAAAEQPDRLGQQDLVLVMVKATGLTGIRLEPLMGTDTSVVFPQNGMAWWYPRGLPADRPQPPDIPIFNVAKRFLSALKPGQVLGGSIYSSNEVIEPGVIRNGSVAHNALLVGGIIAGNDVAENIVRAALMNAGIDSPEVPDIRAALWSKLLVNMSGSTIALATERMSSVSRGDPALAAVYVRLVREGLAIARAHGYPLDGMMVPERLLAALLDHKPSLLQDFELHRPMEVAEIIGAPVAFARSLGIETPTLDALAAVVTRRARDRGLLT